MSREFDWAQDIEQREREHAIARARAAEAGGASDGFCDDCGCEIPLKRLHAAPAARRCIICQDVFERVRS